MDTETVPQTGARSGPTPALGKRSTAMDVIRGVNLDGKTAVVTGARSKPCGDARMKTGAP